MDKHPATKEAQPREGVHPLIEPTLFYNPPYERPVEDEFAWHLVKYLSPASAMDYQRSVDTPCGRFWIDFVVEFGKVWIGFEIGDVEGVWGEEQECLRDAVLIGSGAVDVLYRLRGSDVLYRLHDCLALIAKWEPDLFSARGHVNLNTLASPEAQAAAPRPSDSECKLTFRTPEIVDEYEGETFTWPSDEQEPQELVVRRLSAGHPASWVRDYDRALAHYGISADDLKGRWRKTA